MLAGDLSKLSKDELLDLAWRGGKAGRVLMHKGQQALYDQYRAWEQIDPFAPDAPPPVEGSYPLIFGLPISKRWGKTSWILWVKDEDARARPNSRIRIATAAQNDIKEIVDQVYQVVFATCPEDLRPVYQGSRGPLGEGFYYPHNGSFVSLVGLDQRPNAGRGRRSDGDVVSEAAFVRHLQYIVTNVYLHSYQNIPHARLILESSAPADRDTAWELEFLPDFVARGAYYSATIDDNPRLTQRQIDVYCAAYRGGRNSPDCQREFFNVIAPPPGVLVLPEFNENEHVAPASGEGALSYTWRDGESREMPEFAHAYVAMDPGTRDMFAILWAFWDFENARLVIQQDYAERGALTRDVIEVMRSTEAELWGEPDPPPPAGAPMPAEGWDQHAPARARDMTGGPRLTFFDRFGGGHGSGPSPYTRRPGAGGGLCRPNPYIRVGDTDAAGIRLYHDLSNDYGMEVMPTDKTDSKEARLSAVRDALANGKILLHPRCTKLISHMRAARWNKQRTDYERTPLHGHFDLVDALVYLWRVVAPGLNPNPPMAPDPAHARDGIAPKWASKDADLSAIESLFGVDVAGDVIKW